MPTKNASAADVQPVDGHPSDHPQAPQQIVQDSGHAVVSTTATTAGDAPGEVLWASVTTVDGDNGANTEVVSEVEDDQKRIDDVYERLAQANTEQMQEKNRQGVQDNAPEGAVEETQPAEKPAGESASADDAAADKRGARR